MLNGYDRLLLTQAIVPPTGYALDEALGTTYSLDLLALVAVSLAASGVDAEMLEKPEPADALVLLEAVLRQHRFIRVDDDRTLRAIDDDQFIFTQQFARGVQRDDGGDFQAADDVLHLTRIVVGDAHDLGVAHVAGVREQVIHVPEIEIDAGDAEFFAGRHGRSKLRAVA